MDIQQPPRGASLDSPEMQRFLQDTYNGVKCPLFEVKRVGGHWAIPASGNWYVVPYDSLVFDPLGGWDTTNYRWKPAVPGYYRVHSVMSWYYDGPNPVGTWFWHTIWKNGSSPQIGQQITLPNLVGAGYQVVPTTLTCLVYMNGLDDYIDVRVYKSGAVAELILAAEHGQLPHFGAHKLTY